MLEKILGCALITKLRSILLMEADFNATNKLLFGVRMLGNIRKYKLMPEEIYSEWNRIADDGTLSKVLFFDIARQLRRPAGLASVDADNCYDRIPPDGFDDLPVFGCPTTFGGIYAVHNSTHAVLPKNRLRGLGRVCRR